MKYERCQFCRYWDADMTWRNTDYRESQCLRHAPTAEGGNWNRPQWPITKATMGCGDFDLEPKALILYGPKGTT